MLTRRYTVHSCAEDVVLVPVEVGGRPLNAQVPGLIVELVSDDGGRTQTEAFIPDDLEAAKVEFAVGSTFTVTYQKDEG